LFSWLREIEGGLWLDDGTKGNLEAIRQLQRHPWIADPYDGEDYGGTEDEKSAKRASDKKRIMEWQEGVEHVGSGP
jgi:hypothetical protein